MQLVCEDEYGNQDPFVKKFNLLGHSPLARSIATATGSPNFIVLTIAKKDMPKVCMDCTKFSVDMHNLELLIESLVDDLWHLVEPTLNKLENAFMGIIEGIEKAGEEFMHEVDSVGSEIKSLVSSIGDKIDDVSDILHSVSLRRRRGLLDERAGAGGDRSSTERADGAADVLAHLHARLERFEALVTSQPKMKLRTAPAAGE